MVQIIQRVHAAVAQDHRRAARVGGKRNQNYTRCFGLVLGTAQPQGCIFQAAVVFIQNAQGMATGRDLLDHAKLSLAHKRAAAFAVADKLNDIHTRARQLGESEPAAHAAQRRLVILVHGFRVGDQTVQTDVGGHGTDPASLLRLRRGTLRWWRRSRCPRVLSTVGTWWGY